MKAAPPSTSPAAIPAEFRAELQKDGKTLEQFERLPPSHQREYLDWIAQAKREETRRTRIQSAIARIRETAPRKKS